MTVRKTAEATFFERKVAVVKRYNQVNDRNGKMISPVKVTMWTANAASFPNKKQVWVELSGSGSGVLYLYASVDQRECTIPFVDTLTFSSAKYITI